MSDIKSDDDWFRRVLLAAAEELLKRPISRRGNFLIPDADLHRAIRRMSDELECSLPLDDCRPGMDY